VQPVVDGARPPSGLGGRGHARRIGGHAAHAQLDEQALGHGREPGRVPRLDDGGALVALAQRGEEAFGVGGREGEARRKLDEQAAERRAERRRLGEEGVEQRLRITQPPLVRDRARHLHREAEAGRHRGPPTARRWTAGAGGRTRS
jgi:hypothetical protein